MKDSLQSHRRSGRNIGMVSVLAWSSALLFSSSPSSALDLSRTPAGADQLAAHALETGLDVYVGVIEVGDPVPALLGIDPVKMHFPGRLAHDRDFWGTLPPVAALPPWVIGAVDHGTLVSDVAASSDPVFTGVAPGARVCAGWHWNLLEERAAMDGYERLAAVYLFNHSWGFFPPPYPDAASQDALFFDWFGSARDVVQVIAAGNEGLAGNMIVVPGDAHNVITVGAVDDTFAARASYSSYWLAGDASAYPDIRGKPDIVAPGGEMPPDGIENDVAAAPAYIELDGTSFAAPHVAGVSALLVDAGLGLPGPAMRNRLAHKAIILNAARKRLISRPINGNAVASDHLLTGAQPSDYDYLTAAGELRVGASGAGPQTRDWTPTDWSYPAVGGVFTTFNPLDDELGTGVLDAERTLIQHAPGDQGPGPVDPIAWSRDAIAPGMPDDVYTINPMIAKGTFITATLTWDRAVDEADADGVVEDTDVYANGGGGTPVSDLDLKIYRLTDGPPVLVAQSVGIGGAHIGENVEHLHIPVPETGRYEIHVANVDVGGGLVDYGIAWWTAPRVVPLLSEWGIAIMGLLLLAIPVAVYRARHVIG